MSDLGFTVSEDEYENDLFREETLNEAGDPGESRPHFTLPPREPKRGKSATDKLVEQIEAFYISIGVGVSQIQAYNQDGMMIAMGANKLAESWRDPIDKNAAIKRYWTKFFAVGGYAGLIMAHGAIAAAIAKNHGVDPVALFFGKRKDKEVKEDA